MTPKEKAKELFDIMFKHCGNEYRADTDVNGTNEAKQCSLIAVDEILEALEKVAYWQSKGQFKYYEEVKQELLNQNKDE